VNHDFQRSEPKVANGAEYGLQELVCFHNIYTLCIK
jgi:hypothetical protein